MMLSFYHNVTFAADDFACTATQSKLQPFELILTAIVLRLSQIM